MEKMTNSKALAFVLANCELPTDVAEKISNIKLSIDKKNSSERKPTAVQIANQALGEEILAYMVENADTAFTVSDLIKAVPALEGLTPQKVSPLMAKLVAAGSVTKDTDKRKSVFKAVV